MRFLFISHYFYPEVGAPQTRILETAQRLSAAGHHVTVLTGFPNYPDGIIPKEYRHRVLQRERLGEVNVIRSAVYPSPNSGFARRLVNHASFAISSLLAAPLAPQPDVIVAETPPLFSAVTAVLIAWGERAPLVLNVADLWPESAVQLGMLSNPTAIRAASLLESFAYRHAAAITLPTQGMRTSVLQRGEPEDKVFHLPNAVDVDRFTRPPAADLTASGNGRPARVIYCGTVGLAQGVATIVDAASELTQEGAGVEFLIVGDGAERERLARESAERGLSNVRFAGRVPRDDVPGLILSSDVAVLSLRDVPLFEDALPTKMLEYMAAGLPVVASASGDVSRLLARAQAGVACPPGDAAALAAGIREVTGDPERAREMGANGRRYVEANYSRDAFVGSLERIAQRVTDSDAAERDRVTRTYRGYGRSSRRQRAWSGENPGNQQIITRFYEAVHEALQRSGNLPTEERPLLDIGCGNGDLLHWLVRQGVPAEALVGVDLLPDRIATAREAVVGARIELADARELPLKDDSVTAAVLSTVFSSVVKPAERRRVADEARRVLAPDGIIISYDLRVWSPGNRNVRPIGRGELTRLFPDSRIAARSMTLLPPLARRLGDATDSLYPVLAAVAPLRSHLLATIEPQ